jgi:DNA-binding CsgD family transcriptional regulator
VLTEGALQRENADPRLLPIHDLIVSTPALPPGAASSLATARPNLHTSVMATELDQQHARARRELEAGHWESARDQFERLVDRERSPEALEGYGLALWFLGEMEHGVELCQRACLAYGEAGACDRAARLAVWVSHQYLIAGKASLSNGWLARAERALEGQTDCSGAGWVAVERARRAIGAESLANAREALELGRACGDGDLEIFALSVLGQAEIAAGDFEEGLGRLEEAMAAATAGSIRNPHTLAEAYCNMIAATTSAGDWERATEWCELVDEHASSRAILPLYGACRATHAEVLAAAGRWDDAESALDAARAAHAHHYPEVGGPTAAALALLRVRQGRLVEARTLLASREEHPAALHALAELRLAEGEPRVASGLLERAYEHARGDVLLSSRLLVPLVDAYLGSDDVEGAGRCADRLAESAELSGRALVRGRSALARARVARAREDSGTAHELAREALDLFSRLGMPHEAAEARIEVARAVAGEQRALAIDEAKAALTTFRDLGASRAHDSSAAYLRELGVGSSAGARTDETLTARETQVLDLLAQGMTNAQIGKALFISEKTAGHHVSRILSKLGVRNRAEAAALAPRPAGRE